MSGEISSRVKAMLEEITKIEELVRSQTWEIENQDLPNVEEMNDTIGEAVRSLEDITLSGDVDRVSTSDMEEISERTAELKDKITEIIDELANNPTGPTKVTMLNGYNMLSRTTTYLNSTVVNGVNTVAANILFSSAPHNGTFNEFYLMLCTLEQQLIELFEKMNLLAAENEIHDLTDYVVTVKLESKRDLAKHKRNYEMEENNNGN
jgi:hypothetical protein